jgi:hypothetical protein
MPPSTVRRRTGRFSEAVAIPSTGPQGGAVGEERHPLRQLSRGSTLILNSQPWAWQTGA